MPTLIIIWETRDRWVNLILSGCSSLKPFHCNADHPFLCGSVVPVYSVWERLQKSFSHIPTLRCICFYSVAKHSAVFYHILLDCEKVNSTWVEFCKSALFHLSSVVIPQDMSFHEHDVDDVCRQSYEDKSSPVIEVNQDALLMDYQVSSPSVFATHSWIQFQGQWSWETLPASLMVTPPHSLPSHSIFSLSKSNHFYIASTHITYNCATRMRIMDDSKLPESLGDLVVPCVEPRGGKATFGSTVLHCCPPQSTQSNTIFCQTSLTRWLLWTHSFIVHALVMFTSFHIYVCLI